MKLWHWFMCKLDRHVPYFGPDHWDWNAERVVEGKVWCKHCDKRLDI